MIAQRILTIGLGIIMLAPMAWAGIPERAPLPTFERDPNDPPPVLNTASGRIMPTPLPNLHGVPLVPLVAPESTASAGDIGDTCPTRNSRPQLCETI